MMSALPNAMEKPMEPRKSTECDLLSTIQTNQKKKPINLASGSPNSTNKWVKECSQKLRNLALEWFGFLNAVCVCKCLRGLRSQL